jgi:hypothetical protein
MLADATRHGPAQRDDILDTEEAAPGTASGRVLMFTRFNAPSEQIRADSEDFCHLFGGVMPLWW